MSRSVKDFRAKNSKIPVALTIAGSDNSGGAGIQADLKTFTTLGVFGASAITCIVAEHPACVRSITPVPPRRVVEQAQLVFEAFPVAAMKTGMLYSRDIMQALEKMLRGMKKRPPLVVDPVMVASSGAPLFRADAMRTLREKIIPLAALVTPNRDEAALLWGEPIASLPALRAAAYALSRHYGVPFLVKGGHLKLREAVDVLADGKKMSEFRAPFQKGVNPHGTGCTYSAAITASLAKGRSLHQAVIDGKSFITRAIRTHLRYGPHQLLNHLP